MIYTVAGILCLVGIVVSMVLDYNQNKEIINAQIKYQYEKVDSLDKIGDLSLADPNKIYLLELSDEKASCVGTVDSNGKMIVVAHANPHTCGVNDAQ